MLWTTVDDDPVLEAVGGTRKPAAIQGGPAATGEEVVAAADRAAARAIAEHLLEDVRSRLVLSQPLGRERWAGLLRGPGTDVPFPVTRARLTGYREAFEASGRAWCDVPVVVVARHSRDDGRRAVAAVQDQVRPDVVLAMSDQFAAGALDALGASVRVCRWDDSELATTLGFPSVRQSLYDQGVVCARIAAG